MTENSESEDGLDFEVAIKKLADMFPGISNNVIIDELQKSGRFS